MSERTYSEEEVAELLRRAAELQASRPLAGIEKPGLTIDELSAIAADAGLDPEHLRLAARELEGGVGRHLAKSHTSSSEITAERWVPGNLSDLEKEDVIAELRHRFDTAESYDLGMGQSYGKSSVQTLGRSVEWQHIHPWWGTQNRVLIQPREDGVRIRVTQNNVYSGGATGWNTWYALMLAGVAGLITGSAAGSLMTGILVAILTLAVSVPLLLNLSRRAQETQREEVERLADEIGAHVKPLPLSPAPVREEQEQRLEIPDDQYRSEAGREDSRVRQR